MSTKEIKWEELSDKQLSIKLEKSYGNIYLGDVYNDDCDMVYTAEGETVPLPDYCNDPETTNELIERQKITFDGNCAKLVEDEKTFTYNCKNPLRAAIIVMLMEYYDFVNSNEKG